MVVASVEEKRCSKCHQELPLADFHKNRTHTDGLANQCRDCCRETINRHHRDKHHLLFHAVCEVCGGQSVNGGRAGKSLHVDHSPSGLFRGVLCDVCNKTLSRDMTSRRLRALADYLDTRTD